MGNQALPLVRGFDERMTCKALSSFFIVKRRYEYEIYRG